MSDDTCVTLKDLGIELTLTESIIAAGALNDYGEGCHPCAQPIDYPDAGVHVTQFGAPYVLACLKMAASYAHPVHNDDKLTNDLVAKLEAAGVVPCELATPEEPADVEAAIRAELAEMPFWQAKRAEEAAADPEWEEMFEFEGEE